MPRWWDGAYTNVTRSKTPQFDSAPGAANWNLSGTALLGTLGLNASGYSEVWEVPVVTSIAPRQVTDTSADPSWKSFPSYSPDGVWVAFTGHAQSGLGSNGWALWIARPDGTDLRVVEPDWLTWHRPSWSADGQHLAYTITDPATFTQSVRVHTVATGQTRDLGPGSSASFAPDDTMLGLVAPDGSILFYAIHYGFSPMGGFPALAASTYDGLAWSEDATKIAYPYTTGNGAGLAVLGACGARRRRSVRRCRRASTSAGSTAA